MENPAVEPLVAAASDEVRATVAAARRLCLELMPGTIEQVDPASKLIGYGDSVLMGDIVCAIAIHRAHVNLQFPHGTSMPDPEGLLEGTGKTGRHVKLRTPADVERPAVRALVEAAIRVKG